MFFLLACVTPLPPSEAELFSTALAGGDPALCDALERPAVHDDCVVAVLGEGVDCDALQTDIWQHECHFVRAEQLNQQNDHTEALAACGRSGPFQKRCSNHVWRGEFRMLVRGESMEEDAAVLRESEQKLRDYLGDDARWSKAGGPSVASWEYTLKHYFRRVRRVDPAICEELADLGELTVGCAEIASEELHERIVRAFENDAENLGRSLCRNPARFDEGLAWQHTPAPPTWLGWDPDERLRPGLNRAAESVCD